MPQIPEWFVWVVCAVVGFTSLGTVFLTFFPMDGERYENETEEGRKCP